MRRRRSIFSRFAKPATGWIGRHQTSDIRRLTSYKGGSVLHHLLLVSALAASPPSGRDVLKAMHDRYAGKWYRTLTFVQKNTATRPDGSQEHSIWHEYAALPGKLRSSATCVSTVRL